MRSDNQPRSIQVHPSDNVAILINEGGLPAGARFESGLVVREAIPELHKVALRTIPEGAPTIRYGLTIGYAQIEILAGSWVHEGLLELPEAPALDKLPIQEGRGILATPLEGFTF
jgi:galactarate dehydratase